MSRRKQKADRINELLATEGDAVFENTQGFNSGRYASTAKLAKYEALKDEARTIKEDAIERLPVLIESVTETIEERGGTVYVAEDPTDANRYIREVVDDAGAESVVKSKSMTSEELEVNEALEADGVDVWETDLGEFVLQVADEAPSHLVAPAIHRSRDDIATLFNEYFELEEPLESAEELTRFARDYLGEHIKDADIGMTGANFVTADTGTVALVTSEGNARKTLASTDTHVTVAGIEKLIPTFEELQPFIELIGRSGTGQDITSYVSLFTPPLSISGLNFEANELVTETDRDFHLVLVDNGRWAMRDDDQLRETLYCIRCSACANSCANFQHVGGHAFGGETYTGGIATGWEAGVHGLDSAAGFNDLCTGCSRCVNACPVEIDIPWINTVVRDRLNRSGDDGQFDFLVDGLTPDEEPGRLDIQKRFFGNFATIAKLGSATAPLSNWLANRPVSRRIMERMVGVDRRRELPRFRSETFKQWFDARSSSVQSRTARPTGSTDAAGGGGSTTPPADREVLLYPDLYTNHVQIERGKAAVRLLEALGVPVTVPDVPSSGRAPLSQGMVATAREHAQGVLEAVRPHLRDGRDVVVLEPSDLAMFKREYKKLLPTEEFERLRDGSYEILEYVYGLVETDPDVAAALEATTPSNRLAYHSHCQQRTLRLESYTTTILERAGFDVVTSDVECCGMAGSFGYKREYYDLSMDVGAALRDQFAAEDDRRLVASGTSCIEQLDSLFERPTTHPVEVLAAHVVDE